MTHGEDHDPAQGGDPAAREATREGPGVLRIDRIGLSVEDLEAAQRFYTQALGFATSSLETREGAGFAALTGLAGARGQAAVMRLGDQTLELVQFAPPGAPYPEPRAANDPWFQHFAIAVSDMDAAFAPLSRFGSRPISLDGPQRLPPGAGGVTAYKFRDPDGHPLELSHAPKSHWTAKARAASGGPTLGIDHSALAVADLDASLRFYTEGLGLRLGPPSLNRGPEQSRLDGLDDPIVDIATLTTREPGPHLELLYYRRPKSSRPPRRIGVSDIAAVRLVMRSHDLDLLVARAVAAGATAVSPEIAASSTDRGFLLRDPDGHLLELVGARADPASPDRRL